MLGRHTHTFTMRVSQEYNMHNVQHTQRECTIIYGSHGSTRCPIPLPRPPQPTTDNLLCARTHTHANGGAYLPEFSVHCARGANKAVVEITTAHCCVVYGIVARKCSRAQVIKRFGKHGKCRRNYTHRISKSRSSSVVYVFVTSSS